MLDEKASTDPVETRQCPICEGRGLLLGPYDPEARKREIAECGRCDGAGILKVQRGGRLIRLRLRATGGPAADLPAAAGDGEESPPPGKGILDCGDPELVQPPEELGVGARLGRNRPRP